MYTHSTCLTNWLLTCDQIRTFESKMGAVNNNLGITCIKQNCHSSPWYGYFCHWNMFRLWLMQNYPNDERVLYPGYCSTGYNLHNRLRAHTTKSLNMKSWRWDLKVKGESRNDAKSIKMGRLDGGERLTSMAIHVVKSNWKYDHYSKDHRWLWEESERD